MRTLKEKLAAQKARHKRWRKKHRELIRQRRKQAYDANPKHYRQLSEKWRSTHREQSRQTAREWAANNKERARQKQRNYASSLPGKFTMWKSGAKEQHHEWSLSLEYLQSLPLVCSYTGQPLTLSCNQQNTVSLDRIDSTQGYVPGNVAFCTPIINRMKRDLTVSKFQDLCQQVVDHKNRQQQALQTKG